MDTEISYKYYKDGFHPDIKEGHLTIDKQFFKAYLDLPDNPISKRINHCGLISKGDEFAKIFLKNLIEFFDLHTKFENELDEDEKSLLNLYDFLLKQEIIEITFQKY